MSFALEPRQKQLLAVFGGLALILLWSERGRIPWPGASGGLLQSSNSRTETVGDIEVVGLDLALLAARSDEFVLGRDPFRYGEVPRPKPQPREEEPEIRRPDPPPPLPPRDESPKPPSIGHLKYLGSFGRNSERIAVLVSGQEMYNLREGEAFEQSFSIEEIGYESVTIGFVDFPDAPLERLPVGG